MIEQMEMSNDYTVPLINVGETVDTEIKGNIDALGMNTLTLTGTKTGTAGENDDRTDGNHNSDSDNYSASTPMRNKTQGEEDDFNALGNRMDHESDGDDESVVS